MLKIGLTIAAVAIGATAATAGELVGTSTVRDWVAASNDARVLFSVRAGKIAYPDEPPLTAGFKMFQCLEITLGTDRGDGRDDPVAGLLASRRLADVAALCGVLSEN